MKRAGAGCGKTRLCVQYDDHPRLMCTSLCSLMEHQSLVDLAIRCGNNTMHAHKCILAASSPYFREHLEKNPGAEQVIINGLDFATMKSVIEFIYCGETNILEENLKHIVAAAKLFQIRGLQALGTEAIEPDESVYIPQPIFMNNKPKYSSPYVPFANNPTQMLPTPVPLNALPIPETNVITYHGPKAKGPEYVDQVSNMAGIPLEVVPVINTPQLQLNGKTIPNSLIPFDMANKAEQTVERIKDVFAQEMQTNVEIMYKTPEGEYVKVTDEVLRNITGDTLQFQVIDENGCESDIHVLDNKLKQKCDEEKSETKFIDSYNQFISGSYHEETAAIDDGDSHAMVMDSVDYSAQGKEMHQDHTGSHLDLIVEKPAERQETTDVLNEIHSMQFYRNSQYEDNRRNLLENQERHFEEDANKNWH